MMRVNDSKLCFFVSNAFSVREIDEKKYDENIIKNN
jgi:hypothetical protein